MPKSKANTLPKSTAKALPKSKAKAKAKSNITTIKICGEMDLMLICPPYNHFIREMYNSRHALRALMH